MSKDAGIPERAIIIASTHDHSGPDDIGVWGGVPPEYLNFVADQTVAAIESALRDERLGISVLRRNRYRAVSSPENICSPAYPLDTKLRVLFAKGSDGAPFATLINFSAHVTALGKDNTLISPDWPAAAVEAVEKAQSRFDGARDGRLGRAYPARSESDRSPRAVGRRKLRRNRRQARP